MDLTPRVQQAEHSATLQVKEAIARHRADGVDVINMAPGSPDFDTPAHINQAAVDALEAGHTQTTEAKGIPALREAIATKLREDNGVETSADRIVATPGSKFSLFASILATVDDGDEVVVLDPSWVSYSQMVTLAGGDLTRVRLDPETGFTVEGADLEAAIGDDTAVLVVNNPNNPTGAVYDRAGLERIRDLAVDHDVTVIADEIYEKLVFDGTFHSLGSLDGMSERTVVVNGFSKAFAMTGWRLGYLSAPANLVDAVAKVQSHAVSCPTSFVQHAGVAALEGPEEPTEGMRAAYQERIEVMLDALESVGVSMPHPRGAFYTFPPVVDEDDVALCEEMLEAEGVAVSPGTAFGHPGRVRISATTGADRIREGIERIGDYLGAS
jgi:aspartate aminotransferase